MNKTKPIHEIRLGSVKAAIWENAVGDGIKFNVTLCRLYREGDEWKTTESFGRDDLLLVAKVADEAHSWIYAQRMARETASAPVPQPARPSSTRQQRADYQN